VFGLYSVGLAVEGVLATRDIAFNTASYFTSTVDLVFCNIHSA